MSTNVTVTKVLPVFSDDRGSISDVLNVTEPIHHVGLVTFTPGAVRANHYHKKSIQYDYVLSGKIELWTKGLNDEEAEMRVLEAGDLAVIPVETIHAYRAIEQSSLLDITSVSRADTGYEDDTVRVPSIIG